VATETAAFFEDIHERLREHLQSARFDITAAVAWFTDRELFDVMCKKAALGVSVRLVLIKDAINTGKQGLNFDRFRDVGGEVYFVRNPKRGGKMMHNKFVVIDRSTVITGSYNWSKQAQRNHENITVVSGDASFAEKYLGAFDDILEMAGHRAVADRPPDLTTVFLRLEVIKNSILLCEHDEAARHVGKLRPFAAEAGLTEIIGHIDNGDYDDAVDMIERFRVERHAVAVYRDQETDVLRLELKTLEFHLTALSDEKAEVERLINEFITRHTLALGEVLGMYFRLRREKLDRERKRHAADREQHEKAYQEAREDQERFQEEYAAAKETPPPPELSSDQQKELKRLYREAIQLCHPDKVGEQDKEDAHRAFVELNEAYQSNNMGRVASILERLRAHAPFSDPADTVDDKTILQKDIDRLLERINALAAEITTLKASETYRTLSPLSDWEQYFEARKEKLSAQIEEMERELSDD
jgi:hypothetical protein